MKKHSRIKGLFTLDKLFICDTIEVQKGITMTIRELIKELLKDELKLDDEIRFYYKIQDDELVGCFFESIAYRDRVEFTIQEDNYIERTNNDKR